MYSLMLTSSFSNCWKRSKTSPTASAGFFFS